MSIHLPAEHFFLCPAAAHLYTRPYNVPSAHMRRTAAFRQLVDQALANVRHASGRLVQQLRLIRKKEEKVICPDRLHKVVPDTAVEHAHACQAHRQYPRHHFADLFPALFVLRLVHADVREFQIFKVAFAAQLTDIRVAHHIIFFVSGQRHFPAHNAVVVPLDGFGQFQIRLEYFVRGKIFCLVQLFAQSILHNTGVRIPAPELQVPVHIQLMPGQLVHHDQRAAFAQPRSMPSTERAALHLRAQTRPPGILLPVV